MNQANTPATTLYGGVDIASFFCFRNNHLRPYDDTYFLGQAGFERLKILPIKFDNRGGGKYEGVKNTGKEKTFSFVLQFLFKLNIQGASGHSYIQK